MTSVRPTEKLELKNYQFMINCIICYDVLTAPFTLNMTSRKNLVKAGSTVTLDIGISNHASHQTARFHLTVNGKSLQNFTLKEKESQM